MPLQLGIIIEYSNLLDIYIEYRDDLGF